MSLEEVNDYVEERYQEAEKRLDEAVRNDKPHDIQFWRGYREFAQRMVEAIQK